MLLLALATAASLSLSGCDSSEAVVAPPTPDAGVLPPLSPACKSDSECGGRRCDPLKGCVDCLFDSQCPMGSRCASSKCEAVVRCATSKECTKPANPVCDTAAKQCVRCMANTDCGKNELCNNNRCEPFTPCVNSLDCQGDKVCDRTVGRCVGCVANVDCGERNVCVESTCVPSCSSDKECSPLGLLCDTAHGHCVQCVQQVDCPQVYHCATGKCVLDVCARGETSCDPLLEGRRTCNAVGDGFETIPCAAQQSCTTESGKVVCKPWVCTPGASTCDPTHKIVESCSSDGLRVEQPKNCSTDNKVCHDGACLERLCEPGKKFCNGQNVQLCGDDGATATMVQTCFVNQHCDTTTASCVANSCTPGAKVCSGSVASVCMSDGTPGPGGTDCSMSGAVCFAGDCKPKLCEPNTTFCKDSSIYQCADSGSREQFNRTCSLGTYCDATTQPAACLTQRCRPNSMACNSQIATTCKSDGSGYLPGGTDCAAAGKVCVSGSCWTKVCEPNSYYCKNGNVYSCGDGTSESVYRTCAPSLYCNATTSPPTCSALKCTPNGLACNGQIATTCNADGSGYVSGGTDCAAAGKVCVNGNCLPKICEPNSYFCSGGNVQLCGSTGASSTLYATCYDYQFCQDGLYYCPSDVCTAGTPVCNGDVLSTCKPDGSGPAAGGTDCTATSKVCDSGQCRAVVCTANQRFCQGGNVYQCNAKGTASSLSSACASNQYCDGSSSPAVCRIDVCTSGGPACSGETVAVCNADGSGYSSTSTDCSASHQVCVLAPGTASCAATAVDTLGGSTSLGVSSYNYLYGQFYSATKARKLTQIEGYFSLTGTSLFTWVVYSSTTQDSTYDKIFELTTSSSGTATFHSSGTINVALEKDKFYFIGVILSGGTYFYASSALPLPVSFGEAWTGANIYLPGGAPSTIGYSSSSNVFYQRVTTAPP